MTALAGEDRRRTLIASAALATGSAAAAQDDPICADRPGKANPSCTVPAGMVQVETGFADWSRDRSGGVRTEELRIGATAVKLGLTDRLHVEVNIAPHARMSVREAGVRDRVSGFGDSGVALKYRMTGESSAVQAAVYPFVKIPTAKRPLGNGKVEGGVALLVDSSFAGSSIGWTIAPELSVVADSDGTGHHLATVQVVSIGVPLAQRLGAALDLWAQWDFDPAGTIRQYSIGPSVAYLVSNDLQIDGGIDFGLNRDTADLAVGAAIALRF